LPTLLEMWDVVRGDLNRYYQVRDPTIPLKILERLALNLANPVSWQKLAREADVDVKTVQAYVDLFTDAHLFLVVHRWEEGTLARRADKKIYPLDPLIAGLAGVVNRRDRFVPDPTLAAESLLAVGLFRATEAEATAAFGVQQGVLYFRTSSNREVDFLVGPDRAPFESKYAESVDRRAVQVMEQAFGRGVLVTKRTLDLNGKTVLIPAPLVLSMLAHRS
jgi:predicted AAA+ superfamily ATPase